MDNLVFESVLYKGTSKPPLLFEIALHLNQVQTKGELVLHIIHIAGIWMIDAGIDGQHRGNTLGVTMRGLNLSQFVPLGKGKVERSKGFETKLR